MMEPVPLQMPLSLLPFCLSSTSPGCLWTQPSPVVTMPGQALPQVAVGSTLGWQQLAGPPKPRCLRSNLELQSRGNPKWKSPFPSLIFSSSLQRHIFSHFYTWELSLNLQAVSGLNTDENLTSSYNSFPTFSVKVKIKEKEMRKDINYLSKSFSKFRISHPFLV